MAVPTVNSADWSVLPPGAQETIALGVFTAIVKYIGPWSQRIVFANAMIGKLYWTGYLDDGSPDSRERIRLGPRGVSATMGAFKGEQQAIGPRTDRLSGVTWLESYEKAVVTVTYKLPGVGDPVEVAGTALRGGGVISETFEPNAEFSTLDHERFEWFDSAVTLSNENKKVAEKEAPGKLFVGMDYIFTRHGVTSIVPELFTKVNHVNSTNLRLMTPILSAIDFAPETMLYRGSRLSRNVSATGESKLDVTMTFGLRQVPGPDDTTTGWNHFFHGGVGKWLRLARKGETPAAGRIHRNFPSADLNVL